MKNLTTTQIQKLTGASTSMAIEIKYNGFLENLKIYTNKGNYANHTIAFCEKKFNATFEYGNDAPRGGKNGNYAVMVNYNVKAVKAFKAALVDADNKAGEEANAIAIDKANKLRTMIITDAEAQLFLSKIEGLSNKQARKVAHNFAAKKLGFYSTDGMAAFFSLSKSEAS
jgi:hypothetical protein